MDKYELMETEFPAACEMCYAVYSGRMVPVEEPSTFLLFLLGEVDPRGVNPKNLL